MTPQGSDIVFQAIKTSLREKRGCLVGRFGTIECETLYKLVVQRPDTVHVDEREILERNAGIFPSNLPSLLAWAAACREAYGTSDVLATGWYAPMMKLEAELLEQWNWKGQSVSLRALEPYYITEPEKRWTTLLAGRRVCVVSSFTETASRQVAKGEKRVWCQDDGSLWPTDTTWSWVQTGYAPILAQGRAGWIDSPENWQQAVHGVVQEVLLTGADIVLVGCGGLGMILGAELKKRGKVCIVMGGAIQVLFGIKDSVGLHIL